MVSNPPFSYLTVTSSVHFRLPDLNSPTLNDMTLSKKATISAAEKRAKAKRKDNDALEKVKEGVQKLRISRESRDK